MQLDMGTFGPDNQSLTAFHMYAQASVELCWLTCVSSELNGGELTRSGGVDALGRLLQRCLDVLPRDAAPTLPATVISTHCLRTFAGMASFADARQQLAEQQSLVADIVQSCGLERATGAVDAALQCIIQMAASPALQVPCPCTFAASATLSVRHSPCRLFHLKH